MITCEFDRRRFLKWTGAVAIGSMATQLTLGDLASAASSSPLAPRHPSSFWLRSTVETTDSTRWCRSRTRHTRARGRILPSRGLRFSPFLTPWGSTRPCPRSVICTRKTTSPSFRGRATPTPACRTSSRWLSGKRPRRRATWPLAGSAGGLDLQPHNPFDAIGVGSTIPPSMIGQKPWPPWLTRQVSKCPGGQWRDCCPSRGCLIIGRFSGGIGRNVDCRLFRHLERARPPRAPRVRGTRYWPRLVARRDHD